MDAWWFGLLVGLLVSPVLSGDTRPASLRVWLVGSLSIGALLLGWFVGWLAGGLLRSDLGILPPLVCVVDCRVGWLSGWLVRFSVCCFFWLIGRRWLLR